MALTVLASVRAYVSPSLELDARAAAAISLSSSFLVVAPFLVLRHQRRARDLFVRLAPKLAGTRCAEAVSSFQRAEPFVRALVPIPVALALWAYLANPSFFGDRVGLGLPPHPIALLGAGVLTLAGFSAGLGVSSAVRSIVACVVLARVPDTWEPFTESASENAEALGVLANTSSSYFSIAGALLLPGVVVVAGAVGGAGFVALLAIAVLLGTIASATLVIPAWAIHRGSALDKADFVGKLSEEITPLADAWMSSDRVRDVDARLEYYRLRSLLEIRLQVVSQPSSPTAMRLLQRLPGSVIAPAIAIWLR